MADVCVDFAERHWLNVDGVRANVFGHCVGGAALAIALLHDDCARTRARLRMVAFSQLSIFSEYSPSNSLKAALRLASILPFFSAAPGAGGRDHRRRSVRSGELLLVRHRAVGRACRRRDRRLPCVMGGLAGVLAAGWH